MKRAIMILLLAFLTPVSGLATNGDNLIGVGVVSRTMGGVGIAAPQDAMSAIFSNPAAMCTAPYCPGSQVVISGTIFSPTVEAEVTIMGNKKRARSEMEVFIVPAVGLSVPITERLRFGFGAYGVSGMGVDYRNKGFDLDNDPANGYEGDVFTKLEIMRFAPNIAYLITPNLSIGASLHVVYGSLDLGRGSSHNYTVGIQLGTIYKKGPFSFGLIYVSPEKVKHERVYDFDSDGTADTLELESPQSIGFGVAFESGNLLIEADTRWYNWADAEGYKDFDWDNQWVYALGVQYRLGSRFVVRAGYNYGENPVKIHNRFNAMGLTEIQGKQTPILGYEYLRIIGFPAIVEHHITMGMGYKISEKAGLYLGYMHAFSKDVVEEDSLGIFRLRSELKEDSYEFGLILNF